MQQQQQGGRRHEQPQPIGMQQCILFQRMDSYFSDYVACSRAQSTWEAHQRALMDNARGKLNTVCRASDLKGWRTRDAQRSPFARVGLYMEKDPFKRKYHVNQFLLHSSSRVYEGLVEFQDKQHEDIARGGSEEAASELERSSLSIMIPADVTEDVRCALCVSLYIACVFYRKTIFPGRAVGDGFCDRRPIQDDAMH